MLDVYTAKYKDEMFQFKAFLAKYGQVGHH